MDVNIIHDSLQGSCEAEGVSVCVIIGRGSERNLSG